MLYPALTVITGIIMVIISAVSLVVSVRAGGIVINQVRFLASGILLALHFPLTHFLAGLILPYFEKLGPIEGNADASLWTAVALIVTAQLIILPTSRELYGAYLADRLLRRAAA